ncbi:MAG: DUF1295 domain-containing protein [Candidatus Izemoplasmatales bacterium]|jgi:steroid 5-alpha reductase family enzyme|nr:DUF1295 domain-containing protein [Candidatus Izemoplasmatales bacterium]MDD4354983.1 DUF1295 domain-containing protein [Candidatus Izemoplasmatales bacterium]MDD4987999.1 DUF1295 domain-containing protein [Candidatus Izemoplasmatales bacterium]MDY0372572.1 DUF1295 domain-containing protein [Candidatus Izemoplasmatales bacterium]NLF48190.1 DUF1295 domain-containing protein [Acholeplasmataceae bacterium]
MDWLYLLGVLLCLILYFSIFFVIAQIKKNNAIVDIAWGLGFVVIAWYSLIYQWIKVGTPYLFQFVVTGLTTLWGFRLFFYISIRNFKKPEDFRYQDMRKKWAGKNPYIQAFFRVFMAQAGFMSLISLPILAAYTATKESPLWLVIPGGIVFLIGLFFEAIGDAQLRAFIKKPENRGHIMQSGLWKYTRHPNYFGETLIWWGLWIVVLGADYGPYALFSPLLITYLLLFVSGIPLLEKKYADHPEFQDYKRRTSVFFPCPPKK